MQETLEARPPEATPPHTGTGILEIKLSSKTQLTRAQKGRIVCGRGEPAALFLVALATGGLHMYMVIQYGGVRRQYVFVFLCLAILLWGLVVTYLVQYLKLVLKPLKPKRTKARAKHSHGPTCVQLYRKARQAKRQFNINGKYYLWKLYTMELAEHVTQTINFIDVYSCSLEPWAVRLIAFLIVAETIEATYNIFHMKRSIQRDRQVVIDMCVDVFSTAFPISLMWFVFGIPIDIMKMIQLTVVPTITLGLKLRTLLREFHRRAKDKIRFHAEMTTKNTNRVSVLHPEVSNIHVQIDAIPTHARWMFLVLNGGFIVFFGTLLVVQIVQMPSATVCVSVHSSELWNGCRVRVPFCENPFQGRCDCAVVQVFNYSKAEFPDSFGNMSSLLKLGVYTGQLERLPTTLGEDHKRLVDIQVLKNKLRELPQSIVKIEGLLKLIVGNNRLRVLPKDIGKLTKLVTLVVNGNELTSLPDDVTMLRNLRYLQISNNNITTLPHHIGHMAALEELLARYNRLRTLPRSLVDLTNLQLLSLGNNTLASVPESFGHLEDLVEVDLAMNALHKLPSSVENLRNVIMFDVVGNPLCSRSYDFPANLLELKTEGLCRRRCSPSCRESWKGDKYCDDNDYTYLDTMRAFRALGIALPDIEPVPNSECNTASCGFDGGDCPAPR